MEQKWQMQGGGTLTLSQEGNRVRLEAERPEDSQGLYKVWLTGAQGGRLLLGTLAPERGALRQDAVRGGAGAGGVLAAPGSSGAAGFSLLSQRAVVPGAAS